MDGCRCRKIAPRSCRPHVVVRGRRNGRRPRGRLGGQSCAPRLPSPQTKEHPLLGDAASPCTAAFPVHDEMQTRSMTKCKQYDRIDLDND